MGQHCMQGVSEARLAAWTQSQLANLDAGHPACTCLDSRNAVPTPPAGPARAVQCAQPGPPIGQAEALSVHSRPHHQPEAVRTSNLLHTPNCAWQPSPGSQPPPQPDAASQWQVGENSTQTKPNEPGSRVQALGAHCSPDFTSRLLWRHTSSNPARQSLDLAARSRLPACTAAAGDKTGSDTLSYSHAHLAARSRLSACTQSNHHQPTQQGRESLYEQPSAPGSQVQAVSVHSSWRQQYRINRDSIDCQCRLLPQTERFL